eukprot:gene20792-27621_t
MTALRPPVVHSTPCGTSYGMAPVRMRGSSARRRGAPIASLQSFVSFATSVMSPAATTTRSPVGEDLGWKTDFDASYVKGKVLGQGSFGIVHQGINMRSGKEVAVKVMPKTRNKVSKERTLQKIIRETEILERLQRCKGVVQLEDCFEDDSNIAMILEYCGGGDLNKFVESYGSLDERSLALVAREVLKVVSACHKLGIVHGDVKPANFCLKHERKNPLSDPDFPTDSEPWLKALDFGCSQSLPIGDLVLTKRTGTPVYMAPEIYDREYDSSVDVWSTGVMLYWLFSQQFPFFPDVEVIKRAKFDDVADAVQHAKIAYDWGPWLDMSSEGRDFIKRCLQRDPRKRLTVAKALKHPWLTNALREKKPRKEDAKVSMAA